MRTAARATRQPQRRLPACREPRHRARIRASPSSRPRWPLRATLLRRSRSLGRPAENTAAAFAQTGPLPMHAGRDPVHAGNFRRAEPEDITSAESSLIILSESTARGRQHRQAECQAGHQREISDFEPINSHRCPQKSTGIAVVHHAVRRVGINHDRIEMLEHIKIREKPMHRNSRLRVASRFHASTDLRAQR